MTAKHVFKRQFPNEPLRAVGTLCRLTLRFQSPPETLCRINARSVTCTRDRLSVSRHSTVPFKMGRSQGAPSTLTLCRHDSNVETKPSEQEVSNVWGLRCAAMMNGSMDCLRFDSAL